MAPLPFAAAPDFADVPLAPSHADPLFNVASNLPASADRATAREEIRVPKATLEPSRPVRVFSGNETAPTLDVPSDYQSDGYEDLLS